MKDSNLTKAINQHLSHLPRQTPHPRLHRYNLCQLPVTQPNHILQLFQNLQLSPMYQIACLRHQALTMAVLDSTVLVTGIEIGTEVSPIIQTPLKLTSYWRTIMIKILVMFSIKLREMSMTGLPVVMIRILQFITTTAVIVNSKVGLLEIKVY